jgi:hypothetical protein
LLHIDELVIKVDKIATLLCPVSTVSLSTSMISVTLVLFLVGLLLPRELDAFSTAAQALLGSKYRCGHHFGIAVRDHGRVRSARRDTATGRAQTAAESGIPSGLRRQFSFRSQPATVLLSALNDSAGNGDSSNDNDPEPADERDGGIDLALDPRLYRVRLPRTMGIDWKTDLSFRWVSVRGMDPTGAARYENGLHCGSRRARLQFASADRVGQSYRVILQLVAFDSRTACPA